MKEPAESLPLERQRFNRIHDIIGQRFGRLTVICMALERTQSNKPKCHCLCDCGRFVTVQTAGVKIGDTKSCGCLRAEYAGLQSCTHGMSKSLEYRKWKGIIQRCTNPNTTGFEHWGGRGIKMCKRWMSAFVCFFEDVGEMPKGRYTIDRIDNDGHYSCGKCEECAENGWPMNVRWVTQYDQMRNTSRTFKIEFQGKVMCLTDWAKEKGLHIMTLYSRLIRLKWTPERALSTPQRPRGTNN